MPQRTFRPINPDLLTSTAMDRFWAKTVAGTDGCILWSATHDQKGYGHFCLDGLVWAAHRIAWVDAHRADISADLELDHLCRVTSCVAPDHLEAVPRRVNIGRATSRAARTMLAVERSQTCSRGHDMTLPDAWRLRGDGHRYCRECQRERNRENMRRKYVPVVHASL